MRKLRSEDAFKIAKSILKERLGIDLDLLKQYGEGFQYQYYNYSIGGHGDFYKLMIYDMSSDEEAKLPEGEIGLTGWIIPPKAIVSVIVERRFGDAVIYRYVNQFPWHGSDDMHVGVHEILGEKEARTLLARELYQRYGHQISPEMMENSFWEMISDDYMFNLLLKLKCSKKQVKPIMSVYIDRVTKVISIIRCMEQYPWEVE